MDILRTTKLVIILQHHNIDAIDVTSVTELAHIAWGTRTTAVHSVTATSIVAPAGSTAFQSILLGGTGVITGFPLPSRLTQAASCKYNFTSSHSKVRHQIDVYSLLSVQVP